MLLYVSQLSWYLAGAARRSRLGVLDESRLPLRVWPVDLDTNGHMNNGRYLTLMDYGRLDLVARNGLGRAVLKHRWQPVVAASMIRYRKPLRPFERYELCTRIACFDDKWFFLEQRFEAGGELAAQAFVRGTFRGRGVTVSTSRLLEVMGASVPSPPVPEAILRWQDAESAARRPCAAGRESGLTSDPSARSLPAP